MDYFAHKNGEKKELLIDHLKLVGKLSEEYGNDFGAGLIAKQEGLLHDVGKHTKKFMKILNHEMTKVDHAIVGAKYYFNKVNDLNIYGELVCILSENIAAHHSELFSYWDSDRFHLPNNDTECGEITEDEGKEDALSSVHEFEEICEYIQKENLLIDISKDKFNSAVLENNISYMLYQRMLFSCLVDADYTATANFEHEYYIDEAKDIVLEPEILLKRLYQYHDSLMQKKQHSPMNDLRNLVWESAGNMGGKLKKGFYSMTAPTGTGKTLALVHFALQHVARNRQKKIIIVLPYLSIINQNVKIYKEIFGDNIVFEDDSQTLFSEETKYYQDRWSAPIIVTTSVKFFELMFKARAASLRKLHQITNAVVVFDESQTLPLRLTDTSMNALESLTKYFNSTVLLSTATPIPYEYRKNNGVSIKEIMENVQQLYDKYHQIKNTKVIFGENELDYQEIFSIFKSETAVLWVVNTKRKAKELYNIIIKEKPDQAYLLYSDMCASHKLDLISEINQKLDQNENVYLISTQCIEAGVDVDFPCVAREYSPYMSLVQTLGRCNRHGEHEGKAYIFLTKMNNRYDFPDIDYKTMSDYTFRFVKGNDWYVNPDNIYNMKQYYKEIFSGQCTEAEVDDDKLLEAIENYDYIETDKQYYFIEEKTCEYTVIVPYRKEMSLFNEILQQVSSKDYCISKVEMKKCAPITVHIQLYGEEMEKLKRNCKQLYLHTSAGNFLVNWLILMNEEMYNGIGLMTENTEGGMFL